jgi:hypothetical protein
MVGRVLELAHEVARDEDGAALCSEPAEGLAHPLDALRVEADRGLVEDQDLGIAEERNGDPQPLPHPQRERAGSSTTDLRETYEPEHVVRPAGRDPVALREPAEVAPRRAARVERTRVEKRADHRQRAGDRLVALSPDQGVAGVGRRESEEHLHGRRFSGAVRPDEPGHESGSNRDRQVGERDRSAVSLGDAVGFDHHVHARSTVRIRRRDRVARGRCFPAAAVG